MIKRIRLRNFRAFKRLDMNLSKINILVGPNNSGKSAIISALNLLSQTLQSADSEVPLLLAGRRVDLGTYQDVVYGNDYALPMGFLLEFELSSGRRRPETFGFEIKYRYQRNKRQISLVAARVYASNHQLELRVVSKANRGRHWGRVITGAGRSKRETRERIEYSQFLPYFSTMYDWPNDREPRKRMEQLLGLMILTQEAKEELTSMEYIGPFREDPKRTYYFSGERPSSAGKKGENAISMLVSGSEQARRRIARNSSRWLRQSGIGRSARTEIIDERHFEMVLSHVETGETENIADVGYGCSQILPILVAGYNLERGRTFAIEQPELHLHPRAQAELGSFLYDLYKRDVQTIVETHSEHMILRLQNLVARGLIAPDDLGIFYVHGIRNRNKEVVQLRLDRNGYFETDWPGGFFPEGLQEAMNLSRAQSGGD